MQHVTARRSSRHRCFRPARYHKSIRRPYYNVAPQWSHKTWYSKVSSLPAHLSLSGVGVRPFTPTLDSRPCQQITSMPRSPEESGSTVLGPWSRAIRKRRAHSAKFLTWLAKCLWVFRAEMHRINLQKHLFSPSENLAMQRSRGHQLATCSQSGKARTSVTGMRP